MKMVYQLEDIENECLSMARDWTLWAESAKEKVSDKTRTIKKSVYSYLRWNSN